MEDKTYRFKTGVVVGITKEEIYAKDNSGIDKMSAKNIDALSYEEQIQPRISPAGLCTIPFTLGALMMIFWGGDNNKLGLFLVIIGAVGFVFIFFDAMLQLNLARTLIAKVWSYKGYAVTIRNNSGNNILFYTDLTELKKIKEVENKISELKLFLSSTKETATNGQQPVSNSNLDELKKLAELFASGIITQEEFDMKKRELLK
jgi:hypothetical protein